MIVLHLCVCWRTDSTHVFGCRDWCFQPASNECVLTPCSFHRHECYSAMSKRFEVLLVDIKSRYMVGNIIGRRKKKTTFFPATSLVLLVCDQKGGLTWFSTVLSTHTSQWSWWEVQELSVFEINPRIWLIMLWRRYLTTKWKYIQIEGSKALNILLWTNLSGGVSVTKLQLLYSSYNNFTQTIFSIF